MTTTATPEKYDSLVFDIEKHPAPLSPDARARALESLGFGTLFSDHMALIEWSTDKGWHSARITPRRPLSIDPAATVLHYGQEIFEGMKAYRHADGRIALFRPDQNARRFNASARRLSMPEMPEALFQTALKKLVEVDRDWVPESEGSSFYLRPFMFGTEAFLGVRAAKTYTFCIIASPVGSYFGGGTKPVSIWVSQDYSRAARGGTGAAKCGGNYAASFVAQSEAQAMGCDQVVFLDAAESRWVEELGGMNVFFVFRDGSIVTPGLGTILPGITRDSLITLARESGRQVVERPYSFTDWQRDAQNGDLCEVFACGTAAVVAPIGTVRHKDGEFMIGDGKSGPVTEEFRRRLVDIQRGEGTDRHGWVQFVT